MVPCARAPSRSRTAMPARPSSCTVLSTNEVGVAYSVLPPTRLLRGFSQPFRVTCQPQIGWLGYFTFSDRRNSRGPREHAQSAGLASPTAGFLHHNLNLVHF